MLTAAKQRSEITGLQEHASSQQDVYFKLKKNPDYWLKGKPYLDGIEFTFISDMTTLKMEVQPDVQLVRTVTDMITRDALLIPVYETGTGKATRSYVVAGFNERSFIPFWNSEGVWLNNI